MKNILLKKIIIVILLFNVSISVKGQDIHFSQFNTVKTHINPGNTGNIKGDYRGILNFKEQYSSFSNAYKTYYVSFDAPLFKNSTNKKVTGIGFNLFQDVSGDSKTKTMNAMLNLSQTIKTSKNTNLTLGIGVGFINHSANYFGLRWDDQYNGVDYKSDISTSEKFVGNSTTNFDLSTGLVFNSYDQNELALEIGVAVSHLTQPNFGVSITDRIPLKLIIHGSKEFQIINKKMALIPSVFWANQGLSNEINTGLMFRIQTGGSAKFTNYDHNATMQIGLFYRYKDALIPKFVLTLQDKYTLGLSYDINTSSLNLGSKYRGGLEVSFVISGLWSPNYNTTSPITF